MPERLFSNKRLSAVILIISSFTFLNLAFAQEPGTIALISPRTNAGKPFMQALKERKTIRNFSSRPLSLQLLSELLWAANGVNRPKAKGRTAPSANNLQEIDIYVSMQSGLYLYDPFQNSLQLINKQDIRSVTGKQDFVAIAPVTLIYVADLSRAGKRGAKSEFYAACDTGFIGQNVYLYCASEGLATVVRGLFDEQTLSKVMNLRPEQKIILAQTVGYPVQ
ncbi:MAG: SagB/ThcOx family dehydrogenase [Candidatus Omnitrophica bacterium]|nr:SagB/ThcOx family dehydrogenase [Candidatus Omnitrophota bacterium]